MTLQPHVFETARADVISTTTDFGRVRERELPSPVIAASGALRVPGTSSAEPTRVWAPYVRGPESTASGLTWERPAEGNADAETTRKAITELRRISGLTWEQLGKLFDVSRRSVHFWASGKPMNASNEQRLMEVLDVVRGADRGSAGATRSALFELRDGTTAFALLTAERFQDARAVVGAGARQSRPALAELSTAAKAARKPLPPAELVDAQHDRVHRERGASRSARTVRNMQRGTD